MLCSSESTSDPLPIGVLLDGTYRVVARVGKGSMGLVYRAFDERLQRDVAIKVVRPEVVDREGLREQFYTEARAMARVRHPNVVEIHAFGEVGHLPYFVMELVEGVTAERWVASRPSLPLPIDEALGLLDPICRGVQALHEAGAIHRDLKPSNVLVGPAFRVAVTDFGLTRVLDTRGGPCLDGVAGTPAYMAPELILGHDFDPVFAARADVYALGVMAFELITGELPIRGRGSLEMMQAHVYDEPPRPSDVRGDLPVAFDEALLAALRKDPHERTVSAEKLRRDLRRARERSYRAGPPLDILLVDDDEDHRETMELVLRRGLGNVTIQEARSAEEGLQRLVDSPPRIALVDLHMPGMGGAGLVAKARENPKLRGVKIVVVTGIGGAPDWNMLRGLGADGFMVKPVDPDALIAVVQRFCGAPTEPSTSPRPFTERRTLVA
jgi:serine/threonine protein kinase